MTDIERLLEGAGERWRASQADPPEMDAAIFTLLQRSYARLAPFATVAVAAAVIVVAVATGRLGGGPGNGPTGVGGKPASPSALAPSPIVTAAATPATCDVTKPDPIFVPPAPNPASPGGTSAWYGTVTLWTMLDQSGETWEHLPVGPDGLTQKTFWWSTDWVPEADPVPSITVVGTQLDGPGTFVMHNGTNATTPAGNAMLVGVTVPTPGCWRLIGTYLDASLSIVVEVKGD
jgi:hypothetical protein